MTQKPFLPMSDEIAMELVRQWIKPGEQPLGIPFGWVQPEDDATCTLGSVYTTSYETNLYNILFNEVRHKGYTYEPELNVSLATAKQVLRIVQSEGKDIRNNITLPDVIFCAENPTTLFSNLDEDEKCLYRLSILVLNTMTEGHNLACEYLEYLGYEYFNDDPDNSKDWYLYENSAQGYKYDILEILAENPEDLKIQLPYDSPKCDFDYLRKKAIGDYPETVKYLNSLEMAYDEDVTAMDVIEHVFNVDCQYEWERKNILVFLSWVIGWIKEEYAEGNITFKYTDDIDSNVLKSWLFQYENQMTLPGIE